MRNLLYNLSVFGSQKPESEIISERVTGLPRQRETRKDLDLFTSDVGSMLICKLISNIYAPNWLSLRSIVLGNLLIGEGDKGPRVFTTGGNVDVMLHSK